MGCECGWAVAVWNVGRDWVPVGVIEGVGRGDRRGHATQGPVWRQWARPGRGRRRDSLEQGQYVGRWG